MTLEGCPLHAAAHALQVTEQFVPALHGRLGVAPLPGSTTVLDRNTWRMAPCTNDTCPYATPARDLFTGNTVLINRAPYFGFGGFAGRQGSGLITLMHPDVNCCSTIRWRNCSSQMHACARH